MTFRPALWPLALSLVAAAPASQPAPELALVQQHLRGLSTMTADFVQTDRTGRELTGMLTLKQPGRIRFQYQKGVPLLIVADGGALTFVDYQVKQVQRWPVKNSPLGVLLDPSRDLGRYARVVSSDPRQLTVEASDPKRPELPHVTMVFARGAAGPAGLALQGWVALDSQNNRTAVRLSNQRFGQAVGDGFFRYVDPRQSGKGPH